MPPTIKPKPESLRAWGNQIGRKARGESPQGVAQLFQRESVS